MTLAPINPPTEWFSPPNEIPTDRRLTIDASGRVYGYIALWDQCHAGASGCVRPPKGSPTGYEYAHQGFTLTAEGEQVRTAVIAGGTVHASATLDNLQVPEHYENTGNQMMRVRYGEDNNGIWFAGAIWPDLDELMVEKLRASSISGDWRFSAGWRHTQNNAYDFAGACLVNIPGFPTPTDENSVIMRAGQAYSLVASAMRTNLDIVLVDDTFTAFQEDYPCEEDITAAATIEGETAMAEETAPEEVVAATTEDPPVAEVPNVTDLTLGINTKLEDIVNRIGALESMISQSEAERLLQQVIQSREE